MFYKTSFGIYWGHKNFDKNWGLVGLPETDIISCLENSFWFWSKLYTGTKTHELYIKDAMLLSFRSELFTS